MAHRTAPHRRNYCATVTTDATPGIVVGVDGTPRCAWGASTPDYVDYHDHEWGRPLTGETELFERLCLEGFQAGLAWITILRKREGFRAAFRGFDPVIVAAFDADDVDRLLHDAAIVRHRGKIEAAVQNARALLVLHEQGITLHELLWAHADPRRPAPRTPHDVPSTTPASHALSRTLRRHGFRFVGPTTAYAAMQAVGVVNDHLEGCHAR